FIPVCEAQPFTSSTKFHNLLRLPQRLLERILGPCSPSTLSPPGLLENISLSIYSSSPPPHSKYMPLSSHLRLIDRLFSHDALSTHSQLDLDHLSEGHLNLAASS